MSCELLVSLDMMMSHCMEDISANTSASLSSLCSLSFFYKHENHDWQLTVILILHAFGLPSFHPSLKWAPVVKLNCDSDEAVHTWHLWRHVFPSTPPWLEAPEHSGFQATISLWHLYVSHPNLPIPHATHGQPCCWKHALSKLLHLQLSMYMVLHLWSERCKECSTHFWRDVSIQSKGSELPVPLACGLAPPKMSFASPLKSAFLSNGGREDLFFLSPVRVTSILKGHGEPFVLHMLSQYFTNAASAANHWLHFWAATHQFRSPKYVHENEASAWSHLLGGRPLVLDGADGKLCTQSSKGIQKRLRDFEP